MAEFKYKTAFCEACGKPTRWVEIQSGVWQCQECGIQRTQYGARKLAWYECTKCGRIVEKPAGGKYFCATCGPEAIMRQVTTPLTAKERRELMKEETVEDILRSHPAIYAVWSVLDMDRTLSPTTKNVLWQDFVAAWNRRRLLSNEQAELLLRRRW